MVADNDRQKPVDPYEYRATMGLFATGVTAIMVNTAEGIHGMTASSVTSVSLDPLLLLVCVDRRAHMAGLIVEAGRFAINILRSDQEPISRHFAGQPNPDLALEVFTFAGVPALGGCLGTLACTIERVLDGGDHIIVLAQVDAVRRDKELDAPLLYYRGRYRQIGEQNAEEVFTANGRHEKRL